MAPARPAEAFVATAFFAADFLRGTFGLAPSIYNVVRAFYLPSCDCR